MGFVCGQCLCSWSPFNHLLSPPWVEVKLNIATFVLTLRPVEVRKLGQLGKIKVLFIDFKIRYQ